MALEGYRAIGALDFKTLTRFITRYRQRYVLQNMKFEILNENHRDQLFEFEVQNRNWFESLIAPRGDAFYSRTGVISHIAEISNLYRMGKTLPLVLLEEGKIVARANVKKVSLRNKTAEVGYRVSEQYTGNGIGSYCLSELIRLSRLKIGNLQLNAIVLENNPASRHILEKHSFHAIAFEPGYVQINGRTLGCTIMQRPRE